MTIIGTSYFPTVDAAISYYWDQEGGHANAKEAVLTKLREKSIHIGKPPIKPGQEVKLNLKEGRYYIVEK